VRDSAALLDLICQPAPGDPYWRDAPAMSFSEEASRDPGVLRIAFTTRALAAPTIDSECAEAVRETARLCETLGHRVEEAQLPGDFAAAGQSGGVVIAANVAATLDAEVARRGRPLREDEVEDVTWAMYQRGRRVSGSDYIRALQACHAFGRVVANYFQDHDVLLLSTLGTTAVPIGWLRDGGLDGYADRLFAFMPNTQAFNITGQPAMSVPLAMSADGLPIGLEFVARVGDEATLFRFAAQLEQARPWASRRPPL
jgi:Asp-tRNA(Asn)/Glu-tRNA(Gln) amidotransferase A subunit family amidase